MPDFLVIQKLVIYALPLIFAITIHESSHAYVANKYGDNTAKMLGRLSLNPLRHIDIIGTIIFPIIGILFGGIIFGWALPVPINFAKLKNPKRNIFWIALAGPMSNFAMALLWALVLKLSYYLDGYFGVPLGLMGQAGIIINVSLMLINLLPILPLDGGRVLFSLLPAKLAYKYAKIEPFGMWILIILLLFGGFSLVIEPAYRYIVGLIIYLIQ